MRTSRTTTNNDAASASPATPTIAPTDTLPEVSERTVPPTVGRGGEHAPAVTTGRRVAGAARRPHVLDWTA